MSLQGLPYGFSIKDLPLSLKDLPLSLKDLPLTSPLPQRPTQVSSQMTVTRDMRV